MLECRQSGKKPQCQRDRARVEGLPGSDQVLGLDRDGRRSPRVSLISRGEGNR